MLLVKRCILVGVSDEVPWTEDLEKLADDVDEKIIDGLRAVAERLQEKYKKHGIALSITEE